MLRRQRDIFFLPPSFALFCRGLRGLERPFPDLSESDAEVAEGRGQQALTGKLAARFPAVELADHESFY